MALLILIDGTTRTVHPQAGEGQPFAPGEINQLIDTLPGCLEAVVMPANGLYPDTRVMWISEDGIRLGLPRNFAATMLVEGIIRPDDWIKGAALVTTLAEAGEE